MDKTTSSHYAHPKSKTSYLARTAMLAAVICILGPLSIPIGPVPISFTNLAIFLSLSLAGWKIGTAGCVLYILIGLVGLPVFSGFSGGAAVLAGPTGGYIVGFIPMAIITGLIFEKSPNRLIQFVAMVLGTVVCYLLGTMWFCFQSGTGAGEALGLCVIPFIPGDLMKMVIVVITGPLLNRRLLRAGLFLK